MKKKVIALGLGLMLFLSACSTVDKTQPWRDDSGHWHNTRVCRQITSTRYITIPTGQDRHGVTRYLHIPHQVVTTDCEYE